MSREEILEKIESQFAEVQKLRSELSSLEAKIKKGPPQELIDLRNEVEKLKKKEKKLKKREEKLPPKYRVPPYYPLDGEPHHLYENQRLFPPPTPAEEITGRVKYIKREDRVCHPTPFERPQQCRALPIVLARVTINLDESLDNQ